MGKINLESRVISAFIRRKKGHMLRAMETEGYKSVVEKAVQDIRSVLITYAMQPGPDKAVTEGAKSLILELEDALEDGERYVDRHASLFYISPAECRKEQCHILRAIVATKEDFDSLRNAGARRLAAVTRNYKATAAVIVNARRKGIDAALVKPALAAAVRDNYPTREAFLAKEADVINAAEGYISALGAVNMEDAASSETYAALLADIMQKVVSWVYAKASEIEADEVYGKA
ncbi:MAG TPA: hypothetical protein HA362_06485 [Nanoarchaeota archaeon]|nr:hypothetical protein [Nanoarchaeota archaeon]